MKETRERITRVMTRDCFRGVWFGSHSKDRRSHRTFILVTSISILSHTNHCSVDRMTRGLPFRDPPCDLIVLRESLDLTPSVCGSVI